MYQIYLWRTKTQVLKFIFAFLTNTVLLILFAVYCWFSLAVLALVHDFFSIVKLILKIRPYSEANFQIIYAQISIFIPFY